MPTRLEATVAQSSAVTLETVEAAHYPGEIMIPG
jgi:hypothetical protein